MAPPFRADQVGSLLRPQSLVEARQNSTLPWNRLRLGPGAQPSNDTTTTDNDDGSAALATLKAEQDRAIRSVVAEQLRRGIVPITTGEFERPIFYGNFFESLSGFTMRHTPLSDFKTDFPTNRPLREWGIEGRDAGYPTAKKVSLEKSAYLDDWLFFRSLLPESEWSRAKITVPPPGWWHIQLKQPFDTDLFESDEALLRDLSAAVRKEILTLYDAGLRVVQVDDPNLSFFCDEAFLAASKADGVDLDRLLELYIASHNDAVRGLPSDLAVGLHICRGNFPNGVGLASGSYERIARKLFHESAYKLFYLEFDSPRAGDFAPLRHLPVEKAVVLGVVTTKDAQMEELDVLKERVFSAAEAIAQGQGGGRTRDDALRDNLAVSPQCGFASDHAKGGLGMTEERMWEKLELVKRLAEEIWPGWDAKR